MRATIGHPSELSSATSSSLVTIPVGYALVQVRVKDPSFRGKLCPALLEEGKCLNENSCCEYSHSLDEVRSYNQHYRTKLCEFASNGFCKKGKACRFAHSVEELGTCRYPSDKKITYQSCPPSPVPPVRDTSMLSTEPPTPLNSTGGSTDYFFERIPQVPLSQPPVIEDGSESSRYPTTSRICYKAPLEQRTLSQPSVCQRVRKGKYQDRPGAYTQRPALIPSSYQYVENLKYLVPAPNDVIPINTHWQGNAGPFVLTAPHGGSGGYPPGMFYAMPIMYNTRSDSRPTSFALCPQQYVD